MLQVLAVDLGGSKCSAAVVNRDGKILSRRAAPVDVSSSSAPALQIMQLAKELAGGKKLEDAYVAAAVAVPGLVRRDGHGGTLRICLRQWGETCHQRGSS